MSPQPAVAGLCLRGDLAGERVEVDVAVAEDEVRRPLAKLPHDLYGADVAALESRINIERFEHPCHVSGLGRHSSCFSLGMAPREGREDGTAGYAWRDCTLGQRESCG